MADRIGILGGTFDPVHNGHLSIARSFLKSGYIDELWVIPVSSPPHKRDARLTDFHVRKRMLEAAFSEFDHVVISDIENRLAQPSYTIQTLEHLKEAYPEKTFYLCIGEDSLSGFPSWYKPDRILDECELLVAVRPGADTENVGSDLIRKAHFVEHDPVQISSTELRDRIREGQEVTELLPPRVLEIITNEELYKK